jgi:hypothetical protein
VSCAAGRRSTRLAAVLAAAAAALSLGLAAQPSPASAADQLFPPCVRDGLGTGGMNLGGRPNRFEYRDSPYLGMRYDHCRLELRFHLGGYTGITHYNLRWYTSRPDDVHQIEVAAGPAKLYTLRAGDLYGARVWANVQACRRGGFLQPSSCTRWSPTVSVAAFHP